MGPVKPQLVVTGRPNLAAPGPLSAEHDVSRFDSGSAALDDWLRHRALKSEGLAARTYVVCEERRVVGYHCVSSGSVTRETAPTAKVRANMPDQIPVAIIGRLAVDRAYQGRGIGKGLLKDAIFRSVNASGVIGMRAILVHALDAKAAEFYHQYGFKESTFEPRTFFLPIETAIAAVRA